MTDQEENSALSFERIPLFAYLLDPTKKAKIETPDEIQDS